MEKEVNCVNCRAVLDYVKEHNNDDYSYLLKDLDPEIDSLIDPESYLRDPNNWVSCTVATELYKRARLIFHDEMVPYKIAKYMAGNLSFGYGQRIITKSLWSYKKVLKNLQKLNRKWNRNKSVELVWMKSNNAIIRLHWFPGMDVSKDICLYNQGAYTYMPLIWGGKPLILHEEACYFNGASYCEYHLKWPVRNRFYELSSRFFKSKSVLTETIMEMHNDKKIIEKKYEEVKKLNEDLSKKIRQIQAIQNTGKAILSILDLKELLTVIMSTLSNICPIERAIIMLVNDKEQCLEYIHGIGFKGDTPDEIINYRIPLHCVTNILVRVTSTGQPEYVADVENSNLRKNNLILSVIKPKSVYVVPLITRSMVIGVIGMDTVDGNGIPAERRETIDLFAPQIAIAIENARLYKEQKERMLELKRFHALLRSTEKFSFLGTLAARLAHEIKNPMTAIETFIQMLPYQFDDLEYKEDFYKLALEETGRVKGLISELLNLINTKDPQFQRSDLHGLIEKMILLISPQMDKKKIDVVRKFEMGMERIWMDTEKIKQVILNILSNAADYTPVEGRIIISTKGFNDKDNGKYVRIEIKDNGPGIFPLDIKNVFDPYYTTKHKSKMRSGSGLGLFIAHQNVQDHGGILEVESRIKEGATFIITLPVDPFRSGQA
jgi:signal transduction histidine kinase